MAIPVNELGRAFAGASRRLQLVIETILLEAAKGENYEDFSLDEIEDGKAYDINVLGQDSFNKAIDVCKTKTIDESFRLTDTEEFVISANNRPYKPYKSEEFNCSDNNRPYKSERPVKPHSEKKRKHATSKSHKTRSRPSKKKEDFFKHKVSHPKCPEPFNTTPQPLRDETTKSAFEISRVWNPTKKKSTKINWGSPMTNSFVQAKKRKIRWGNTVNEVYKKLHQNNPVIIDLTLD